MVFLVLPSFWLMFYGGSLLLGVMGFCGLWIAFFIVVVLTRQRIATIVVNERGVDLRNKMYPFGDMRGLVYKVPFSGTTGNAAKVDWLLHMGKGKHCPTVYLLYGTNRKELYPKLLGRNTVWAAHTAFVQGCAKYGKEF